MTATVCRFVMCSAIAACVAGPAKGGGPLQAVQVEYLPLIISEMGKVEYCGVHFTAVLTDGVRNFGMQGSLNNSFLDNRLPALLLKMRVFEEINGEAADVRLRFSYVRVGELSTLGFMPLKADVPGAYFGFGESSKVEEYAFVFIDNFLTQGSQLGFNNGDGGDFTFYLPPSTDITAGRSFAECSVQGIDQLKRSAAH